MLEYVGIKVVGGTSDGSRAVINVQTVRQGSNSTGKVLMVLEDRQWKVDMESGRPTPPLNRLLENADDKVSLRSGVSGSPDSEFKKAIQPQ